MTMTIEESINALVPELNSRINIPGIWNEEQEAAKIRSGLEIIMPAVPVKAYPFLISSADGLTNKELERYLEKTLNAAVREAVAPMPSFIQSFVGDNLREALEPLARIVFEYAQMGLNIGMTEPKETDHGI